MSVFVCSDLHLGHKNIAKFRHFVSSCEGNTSLIVSDWRQHINKRDVVYVLGDAAFDQNGLDILATLPGRKILIKGNHDDIVTTYAQSQVFEEIHGMLKYKGMWLTHCPIHPDEMRKCKKNVHGHVHSKSIMKRSWCGVKILDPQYVNACVDVVYPKYGRIFITLDELRG